MFLNELVLERYGSDKWRVHKPLEFTDHTYYFGRLYRVPEGFVTDLASFPRWLWWIPGFNPNGRSRRPAVLHDWLYTACNTTRHEADRIFKEALMQDRTKPWLANLFYTAVRLFGHGEFKRRRTRITSW